MYVLKRSRKAKPTQCFILKHCEIINKTSPLQKCVWACSVLIDQILSEVEHHAGGGSASSVEEKAARLLWGRFGAFK